MNKHTTVRFCLALCVLGGASIQPVVHGLGLDSPQSQSPPAGDSVLAGRVIDAPGNEACAGIVVTLEAQPQATGAPAAPAASPRRVLTDATGRFAFTELIAGAYRLRADAPGYGGGAYGEARLGGPEQLLVISSSERRTNLLLRVWSYGSIEGVVRDDAGDLAVDVPVVALARRVVRGRVTFRSASRTVRTDDRGFYRLTRLLPGEFIVAVPSALATTPIALEEAYWGEQQQGADVATRRSRDLASSQAPALGRPGMSVGRFQVQLPPEGTVALALLPPRPKDGVLEVYPTVFYPSAASVTKASLVTLHPAEDRHNIDVRLTLARTAPVEGAVTRSDGTPASIGLHLVLADGAAEIGTGLGDAFATVSETDGRFTFPAVPIGRYLLQADQAPRVAAGSASGQSDPPLWARVPIEVGAAGLTGIDVQLQSGGKFSGRIQFDSPVGSAPALQQVQIAIERVDGPLVPLWLSRLVNDDGSFATRGYSAGSYYINARVDQGDWIVSSIKLDGRERRDSAFAIESGDVANLVIQLSRGRPQLTGAVRDAKGQADPAAVIRAFPVDYRAWLEEGKDPRRFTEIKPRTDGFYTLSLPADDYWFAAISDGSASADWQTAEYLDALVKVSRRLHLSGPRATLDLQTSNGPRIQVLPAIDSSRAPATTFLGAAPATGVNRKAGTPSTVVANAETGSIAGRVASADDGRPVRRVAVVLTGSGVRGGQFTITDDNGIFAFDNLGEGRFLLSALKPGLLTSYYGSGRPGRGPGVAIALTRGQKIGQIQIPITRGGSIAGTVVSPFGRPAAGAEISALTIRDNSTGRLLLPARVGATDDRGQYRLYGLLPGDYVIASVGSTAAMNVLPQPFLDSLFKPAPGTGSAVGVASSGAASVKSASYAPTYYPNTADPAGASPVRVAAGATSSADLAIQLVPAVSVSGNVSETDPQVLTAAQVSLLPAVRLRDDSRGRIPAKVGSDGRFAFSSVAPGQYKLIAQAGTGAAASWSVTDVTVTGSDIDGLTLAMQKGSVVEGRLVVDSLVAGSALDPARIRVALTPTGASAGLPFATSPVAARADGAFIISGVPPGLFKLDATVTGTAGGWLVKSVTSDGVDLLDSPLTVVTHDVRGLVLTVGDRPSVLAGTLFDTAARASPGFSIVAFSTNRAFWTEGSRRVRQIRTGTDGAYTLAMPAGEYFVVAVTDATQQDLDDADFLDLLSRAALRVTIADGERKTLDLRIAGIDPVGR